MMMASKRSHNGEAGLSGPASRPPASSGLRLSSAEAERWKGFHPRRFQLWVAVSVLASCSRSDPSNLIIPDASTRPDLLESGSPDLAAPDRADAATVDQPDTAVSDPRPATDLPADSSPDVGLPDFAVHDLTAIGEDVNASAILDQAKGDLSPLDVRRPDTNVNDCAYRKAMSSLYVPSRFDFSMLQPDGSSLSCTTRFDGGDSAWKQPITGQISGWVTAVNGTELRVDLCQPGLPCQPAEYRFTVSAAGLTLPSVPIGRRVTVSWWMQNGGWACPRMLVVTDEGSADAGTGGALWFVGVESMPEPKLPLPFTVTRQALYCNPDPSGTSHCGGSDNLPDDYAFEFAAQGGESSLRLGTYQTGTLAIALASGAIQHLSLLTIRCFITGGCDDYWNWAWWGTAHVGASGDPD